MAEIPEEILRRSAEAKAAATGRPVEEILAEMKGEAAATAAVAPASQAASAATAPLADGPLKARAQAAAAALPDHLLRRSAEAKAKALGIPVEEVIAEMTGGATGASPAVDSAAAATPAAGTGEIDWKAAGEKAGMPEKLLRRSLEAKAAATGKTDEAILTEMIGAIPRVVEDAPSPAAPAAEAPAPPAVAPVPSAPTETPATAPGAAAPAAATGEVDWDAAATAAGMPAKLFKRSAEAKAAATGRPIADIVAELTGTPATPAPAPAPTETPATAPAAAAPAPAAAPAAGGAVDWAAAASAAGLPESIFKRSAEARAKASGEPVGKVVAAMSGIESTGAPDPTATAPAAAAAAAPAAAAPAAAAPPAALPPVPDGVNTQRLLTVVQAKAIQGARKEPVDKVNVWPHLLAIEFVALLVVLALLVIFSVFQDAPLLELANPNAQPNPSKAPWYFLGLQELLSYFDPQVAGVLIPGLGLAGIAIIPYIDRNPSTKPSDRKFAIMVFTFFVVASAILTIIGSFYRGKGFNFTFPWRDGIFFDL